MDMFIDDCWAIAALFILLLIFKFLKFRISLWIAIIGASYFALEFLGTISDGSFNLSPMIFLLLCCYFIIAGGKKVAYKTQTAIWDSITNKTIGVMTAGALNWADPILEFTTISTDGVLNLSADLQELKVEIIETPDMQTKTRGIQARVKHTVFMLKLEGDIAGLFRIEGGALTVRKRIKAFTLEFFLDEIGHTDPVDLDTDKGEMLRTLGEKLKEEVNKFCADNNYPYKIVSTVTIGDTELDEAYYAALAKKALAVLEQDAEDVIAQRIRGRLIEFGGAVLEGEGTPKEKLEAAMIALRITPKTINDNKYGVDISIAKALTDIAEILRKK